MSVMELELELLSLFFEPTVKGVATAEQKLEKIAFIHIFIITSTKKDLI
jgi:hypothetical protein